MPGSYVLVDHSIFRAFNKGALAILKVEGAENHAIYSGKEVDCGLSRRRGGRTLTPVSERARRRGERHAHQRTSRSRPENRRFTGTCSVCHQANGQGLPSVFPPLAKSDFLMADKQRAINIVLQRTERQGHGQRQHLQLGHAADEPAERRRARQHPDLRTQQLG